MKSLKERCFFNRHGICYFLVSDPEPCNEVCANFTSFDAALRKKVNARLHVKDKVEKNSAVSAYHLSIAFGHKNKSKNTIQGSL